MSESNLMAKSVPLGRAYEILEDGKPFGSYTIVRCLAYDMLGSLYLVQNEQTNQRETLFVFSSLVAQDRAFPERFAAQTPKLCALKHPNVLHFAQAAIIQNSYCLVGEAFEGLNIPDHVMLLTGSPLSMSESKSVANLPPGQVTPILEQVLAGLAYAHESKVMHLNLNPTKILRSGIGEIKVYGYHFLAILGQELFEMLVSAGIPPLKLDPNHSFLGTTDILSPEARLREPLEYRSDLYAIGVDTHWLLTGRKLTSPYQTPSQLQPGIEVGWDAFAQRCLQRKPGDRYATATAALADLRNLAQLTPLSQKQPLELLLAPETPGVPVARKKKDSKPPVVKKSKPGKPPRHARKPLTLTQRLLFIGLPALILVALAAFSYVEIETSDDLSTSDITAVRTVEGQTPRLRLSITPRNSLVTIGKTVFQVSDGELPLNIAKGDYIILVESPPKYRTKRVPYSVQGQPDHLFVNLDPAWAIVDFSTAPGATIAAQPEHGPAIPLGIADAKGNLHVIQGLGDGNFTFTASKDAYTSAQVTNQKLELTKSYRFELKIIAEPAVITLTTEPAGATVRMGTQVLGQTPFTTKEIPVDTDVELSLEKQGYETVARTLRVRPNITEQIDLGSLSAKMGELALKLQIDGHPPTATELRDAKIIINHRDYPASTGKVPNMLEGSYAVSFQHPDYFPVDQTVAIISNMTSTIAVNLQPRPARLAIHPTPAVPIAVFVNDLNLLPSADGTYSLPPNQADKVRVEAQNYASAVRDFKPAPNQPLAWDTSLSVLPPPKSGQDYQIPYLGLDMKWIPEGNYTMGSPGSEIDRTSTEGPATKVTFPVGFWAGRFDVTQAQYQAIMGDNPAEFGHDAPERYPVERVSWFQAREFTQKLTEREKAANRLPDGYEFRLPTEAEWEYFARAGTTTAFSFGDKADPSKGNFKGSYPMASGSDVTSAGSITSTTPVGSYAPNAWGLYDVHGNVRQWVLDAYKARLPGGDITAPALAKGDDSARRLYRGGGWGDYARDARSAWRDPGQGVRPETTSDQIGLRVVLAPVIATSP